MQMIIIIDTEVMPVERARKHSRKRDAILDCIRGTDCHPTAEWVYQQLKPRIPDLSLATVYRNLTLFKQEGQIISLGVVQGLERFDGNVQPHVHFICTGCGAVLDLPTMEVPLSLRQEAVRAVRGRVTGCSLCFEGLCHTCLQESIPSSPGGETIPRPESQS